MDYRVALKTILTLVGFALLFALMVKFPMVIIIVMLAVLVFTIVAVIYMGFKGDLPDI